MQKDLQCIKKKLVFQYDLNDYIGSLYRNDDKKFY